MSRYSLGARPRRRSIPITTPAAEKSLIRERSAANVIDLNLGRLLLTPQALRGGAIVDGAGLLFRRSERGLLLGAGAE